MKARRAGVPESTSRRRVVGGAAILAIASLSPLRARAAGLPEIPAMSAWLAGRDPQLARVRLALPRLADNGLAVPMRVIVDGPFAPGPHVRAIRLYSDSNPVPEMAVFEFPAPVERVELESRIRLATTQSVVAVAEMTDGRVYAAAAQVVVTLAGCMDGT
jgi:sulfur-oxidizing protein SoxY